MVYIIGTRWQLLPIAVDYCCHVYHPESTEEKPLPKIYCVALKGGMKWSFCNWTMMIWILMLFTRRKKALQVFFFMQKDFLIDESLSYDLTVNHIFNNYVLLPYDLWHSGADVDDEKIVRSRTLSPTSAHSNPFWHQQKHKLPGNLLWNAKRKPFTLFREKWNISEATNNERGVAKGFNARLTKII